MTRSAGIWILVCGIEAHLGCVIEWAKLGQNGPDEAFTVRDQLDGIAVLVNKP
jgi:Rieske Fe-S protein